MERGAVAAALALVLLASVAPHAIAEWSQAGGDASRSSSTLDAGPASGDVALLVDLERGLLGEVLAVGEHAFVLRASAEGAEIVRIDLTSAEVATIGTIASSGLVGDWATDGRRFYVTTPEGMSAIGLDGTRSWTSRWPTREATSEVACEPPLLASQMVYALCSELQRAHDRTVRARIFLQAFEPTSGASLWTHEVARSLDPLSQDGATTGAIIVRIGFAASEGRIFVLTAAWNPEYGFHLRAVDAATGATDWLAAPFGLVSEDPTDPTRPDERVVGAQVAVAAAEDLVYVGLAGVMAFEANSGVLQWTAPIASEAGGGSCIATDRTRVAAMISHRLQVFDARGGGRLWAKEGSPRSQCAEGLVLTPDKLVVLELPQNVDLTSVRDPPPSTLSVYDHSTATLLWSRSGPTVDLSQHRAFTPVVWRDALVVVDESELSVLGRTPASIKIHGHPIAAYPAPGEPMHVDLSGTRPGVQATDIEFRAVWGDGDTSAWQASPSFSHVYGTVGERIARFEARNSAGQTASEEVVIHVGASAPVEPNLVARAFATENQDTTFFILGLVATGAFAAVGLARRQRSRALLDRELRAVEAAGARADAEEELDRAEARGREHFRKRRLHESQLAVLTEHIGRARSSSRLHSLDAHVAQLPHGVVVALRSILRDGRVNAWEEQHVLARLPGDLAPETLARVREALARWREHDAQVRS